MTPIYIIIDETAALSGATDAASTFTDRTKAQAHFTEQMIAGNDMTFIVHYRDEPDQDLTCDATELAALAYLEDRPDCAADAPWVYASDAYETWLKGQSTIAAEARREANHVRACRANL